MRAGSATSSAKRAKTAWVERGSELGTVEAAIEWMMSDGWAASRGRFGRVAKRRTGGKEATKRRSDGATKRRSDEATRGDGVGDGGLDGRGCRPPRGGGGG